MPSKRDVKRDNSGIGDFYKPIVEANIAANNTDFFVSCGAFSDSAMQSAISAYLNDTRGAGVWKTSIKEVPEQVRVFKNRL